jgi:hypothetical protein
MSMIRRLILIAVAIVAALVAMAYVVRPELFTAAGRNARFLRRFNDGGTVLRRSCYSMETFVDAPRWAAFSQSDQERAIKSLAAYCADQGSSGQMTIVEGETRRKLAHWDGTTLQRF